jgi:SAM-dependent methyltransferase
LHAELASVLDPARRAGSSPERDGYLDLLGEDGDPTGRGPGQQLMLSRALPLIYERLWRPLGGRLLMGVLGPDMAGERRIALEMLQIAPGDAVLDVACGPGNFTRAFAGAAGGDGLVVGLDASRTMLAQAARERPGDGIAYVRGSATDLPFRDGSFDAVCCFAALYLIEEPLMALAEIVRVLAPGGRVALLSSVARGPVPSRLADGVVRPLTGVRIFGRDELTRELRAHGLADVRLRLSGLAQFVSARRQDSKPGAPGGPARAR